MTPTQIELMSALVNNEAKEYEWRGDQDYSPTDDERAMLADFGAGLLDHIIEFLKNERLLK